MLKWRYIPLTGVLLLALSCYREEVVVETAGEVFELTISPATQEFIHSSRDTSYSIDDAGMQLTLNGDPVNLKDIRTRGKSALRYTRKSYSVFLRDPVSITGRSGAKEKVMSRFKLLAMPADYTYIENRIGLGLLEQVGVNELFYKFVEFRINDATEGVYMLIEDPEQFFKERGSEYILRRYYHHWIADSEYEPSFYFMPEETYENRFKEIYRLILKHEGEALYQQLESHIHMEHYFRKMGIDYLLKNGDYSDELFFYAMVRNNEIRFDIIPWDYDDLFSDDPHEVGVTWGTGNVFGERYYATYEEVLEVLGEKLIFSIEDDLDYIIATDPYLYARYEEQLRVLIGELESEGFESLFGQIRHELNPYYQRDEIVQQSELDQDKTSPELWESNMIEKQAFLERRLAAMKKQLNSTL